MKIVKNSKLVANGLVANKPVAVVANKMVANADLVANGSRHGVYKDKEARKLYMRELMRKRRAEGKAKT